MPMTGLIKAGMRMVNMPKPASASSPAPSSIARRTPSPGRICDDALGDITTDPDVDRAQNGRRGGPKDAGTERGEVGDDNLHEIDISKWVHGTTHALAR
jgi:hypothetical protein